MKNLPIFDDTVIIAHINGEWNRNKQVTKVTTTIDGVDYEEWARHMTSLECTLDGCVDGILAQKRK
jgi:hypothetical protein